jgi:hypothetical protein|tara:strand:+ start:160 stop:660 length:501 start_codon:yes stop_codon:yes gene_type:complete
MSRPNVTKRNTISAKPAGKPGDKKQPKPRRVKKSTRAKTAKAVKAKQYSRATFTASLDMQILAGMITKAQAIETIAEMDKKGLLTDGSRSKSEVESAMFKAGKKAIAQARKGSPQGCHGFLAENGKKVIVTITTAREGSDKYASLSKNEYLNTDRLLEIEKKKRAK